MQRELDIKNTVIFKKTQSAYLSIRLIRLLIFLDQCHDFLETTARNNWKTQKDIVHKELLNRYFEDVEWIETDTDLYDIRPLAEIVPVQKLLNKLETKAKILSNVSSTQSIKNNFINEIQTTVGIFDVNLQQGLDIWDCTSFSDNLLTLLNPSRGTNNVLIGVDATKASANFSPLFTNICKILYSPDINLNVFNSNATIYDAAGASSVTNQIINMSTQRGRKDIVTGLKPNENQRYVFVHVEPQSKKRTIFFDINYVRSKRDDSIILYINSFFGKKITQPKDKLISSSNNSVSFLTQKYEPTDNIFLFKTFGDLGQIFSFAYESLNKKTFTNIFITFDFLSAVMSSMFIKSTILEDVNNYINGLSIFTINPEVIIYARRLGLGVKEVSTAQILTEMASYTPSRSEMEIEMATDTLRSLKRSRSEFGKSIKNLSLKALKDKLKNVGIKVTKEIQGKRTNLSRKELENKAESFKKLQIKARQRGIKLKTKYGNFKSKESLEKELGKLKKSFFG